MNEHTEKWYKYSIRRDKVKLLMQGLSLPSCKVCSVSPLPVAQLQPTSPQTTSQAAACLQRNSRLSWSGGMQESGGMPPPTLMVFPTVPTNTSNVITTSTVTLMPTELVLPTVSASRNTQWRH